MLLRASRRNFRYQNIRTIVRDGPSVRIQDKVGKVSEQRGPLHRSLGSLVTTPGLPKVSDKNRDTASHIRGSSRNPETQVLG